MLYICPSIASVRRTADHQPSDDTTVVNKDADQVRSKMSDNRTSPLSAGTCKGLRDASVRTARITGPLIALPCDVIETNHSHATETNPRPLESDFR